MCVKRIQELFEKPMVPRKAFKSLIVGQTAIGEYKGAVQLLGQVECLPEEVSKWRDPSSWPRLMKWMNEEVDKRDCKSMIVKPHADAKFLDAMMLTRARSNADEADSNPENLATKRRKRETMTLAIGLVARAAVSKAEVMEHCHKFDQVFKHLDTKTRRQFGRMTNVLIVCAATYSGDLPSFDSSEEASISMEVPDEFSNVTEVLLLNLTTRTKRAKFFGWKKKQELLDAVETVIASAGYDK